MVNLISICLINQCFAFTKKFQLDHSKISDCSILAVSLLHRREFSFCYFHFSSRAWQGSMAYTEFGSNVALIEPDQIKEKPPPTYFEMTKGSRERKELCITLRVFFYTLLSLILLSMTIIATIYISKLQQHVRDIEMRAQSLEVRVGRLERELDGLQNTDTDCVSSYVLTCT